MEKESNRSQATFNDPDNEKEILESNPFDEVSDQPSDDSERLSDDQHLNPLGDRHQYLDEITQTPLLTAEEEVSLSESVARARKARQELAKGRAGVDKSERLYAIIEEGTASQERLLMANTRLVVSVAKRYTGRGVPFLDLIHEGIIGLIRASMKFDPGRGNRFSTYATWWIRQAITRAIDNQSRTIRLPVHKNAEINKMARAASQLTQALGREPIDEELAGVLEITPGQLREIRMVAKAPISLEIPQDSEDDRVLADLLADPQASSPEEVVSNGILEDNVREALDSLPRRESQVLMLRYGFYNGRTHTLQEVGDKMGITRERVRQIESQALNRLRKLSTNLS